MQTLAERRAPEDVSGGFQNINVRFPLGAPSPSISVALRPVSDLNSSVGLPIVALQAMIRGRFRCHSQSRSRRRKTFPTWDPNTPRYTCISSLFRAGRRIGRGRRLAAARARTALRHPRAHARLSAALARMAARHRRPSAGRGRNSALLDRQGRDRRRTCRSMSCSARNSTIATAAPMATISGDDFPDNDLRFARLSLAAAQLAMRGDGGWAPASLHLNDWQTALAAGYLAWSGSKIPTLLTVHNLAHQGVFDAARLARAGNSARPPSPSTASNISASSPSSRRA